MICISILVLIFCALLFLRHSEQHEITSESPQNVSQSTSSIPVTITKTDSMTQLVTASPTNPQLIVNDREKTNAIRQYMESQNKPITFYVKVVDQNGNPLPRVKVKSEVRHIKVIVPAAWGDEDQNIPNERETDLGGRFEVNGVTGANFDVESIQKDGYEAEPFVHTYGTSGGNLENPMIFKMWSTNIHEHLITGEKKFQVVPDGRPYLIDLIKGTIAESGEGDLKIWVKRPDQIIYGKQYDWSCEIGVVNGGLQEADSHSMFSAPADGYVPLFQFEQKIGSGWGDSTGEKRFYVMLNNSREYGRISIELFAYYSDHIPGLIRIQYAINPSGSHILKP